MTEAEYQRLQRLPSALQNTRRKLLMLEREAARHHLYELLDDQEWLLHRNLLRDPALCDPKVVNRAWDAALRRQPTAGAA